MNVLSLFDGISCARVALDRQGIPVKTYTAYEIDKYAIKVSKTNYPTILHKGDVSGCKEFMELDLLVGGSPCTDLSVAKKDREGLKGERSKLFWEYVRILKLMKPKWFILENVYSMKQEDKDIITKELGVEPIMINASLVSAQSRKRYFWTNIPVKGLPEDKKILLKDILQPDGEVDERFVVNGKSFCLTATYSSANTSEAGQKYSETRKQRTLVKIKPKGGEFIQLGYFGAKNACGVGGQALRVYADDAKCPTLGTTCGTLIQLNSDTKTILMSEKQSEHVPKEPQGCSLRGHSKTKDDKYLDHIEFRDDGKISALTATAHDKLALVGREDEKKVIRIRKLTPIECERLQGLPDNYTSSISATQRYKCLGNAFNVDVVAFILSHIPK